MAKHSSYLLEFAKVSSVGELAGLMVLLHFAQVARVFVFSHRGKTKTRATWVNSKKCPIFQQLRIFVSSVPEEGRNDIIRHCFCNETILPSRQSFQPGSPITRNYVPTITLLIYRVSQKKYPLLAGNRNKTIRYYYSPSGQLSLSVFNLDSHTLHLKIVHQTPEIQACEVKFDSAPETRGFEKGPSHDLYDAYFPKHL